MGNTAAARASVLSDLETRHVQWVVEWRQAAGASDGHDSSLTRRERSVQERIAEAFDVVLTQGDFVVRQRARRPAPAR